MKTRLKEGGKLALCLLFCLAAGLLGSYFASRGVPGWYQTLEKSPLNPPDWVFAPLWFILYCLMGTALYLVWKAPHNPEKLPAFAWFLAQWSFNILWSEAFFGLHLPEMGISIILLLWGLIVITMIRFWKIDPRAGRLLWPYWLWVSFAAYLNWEIYRLNP